MFVRLALLGCIALLAMAATGVVLAATTSVQKEVRITARLLENGKVEFGLQERTDGGEWGEILLPTKNKFPYATADVDHWLRSSPVALTPVEFETPDEGIGEAVGDLEPVPVSTPESVVAGFGGWEYQESGSGSGGYVLTGRETSDSRSGESNPYLIVSCLALSTGIQPTVGIWTQDYLLNDHGTGTITVWYRIGEDATRQSTREWRSDADRDSILFLLGNDAKVFVSLVGLGQLAHGNTLDVSARDRTGETFSGTWDITGLYEVFKALPCYSVS